MCACLKFCSSILMSWRAITCCLQAACAEPPPRLHMQVAAHLGQVDAQEGGGGVPGGKGAHGGKAHVAAHHLRLEGSTMRMGGGMMQLAVGTLSSTAWRTCCGPGGRCRTTHENSPAATHQPAEEDPGRDEVVVGAARGLRAQWWLEEEVREIVFSGGTTAGMLRHATPRHACLCFTPCFTLPPNNMHPSPTHPPWS